MKYFIKTFGCQYNEWDAARLDYLLKKTGFILTVEKDADIVFILSCSVRQTGVDRIWGTIRNNKDKKVILTGCILKDDEEKYLKSYPNLIIWDYKKPEELLKILSQCHSGLVYPEWNRRNLESSGQAKNNINIKSLLSEGTIYSNYLPITIGCNNFCSYCAVPYTRGREVSRPFDEIIRDFKDLIRKGHKEIILLGQNVNSYQSPVVSNQLAENRIQKTVNRSVILTLSSTLRDEPSRSTGSGPEWESKAGSDSNESSSKGKDPLRHSVILSSTLRSATSSLRLEENEMKDPNTHKSDFAVLLKTLNDINGNFIISFTSNHPKDMTDDIIQAVRDLPKVKKAIHLPLQSGSNKILKMMNRPYTKEKYLALVDKIKKEIPEIRISTDIIVGFPGEELEDFMETVEILKKINFAQVYINKYSPRSGTAAFELGDPISWLEKERRWNILNDIAYFKKK